jgi:uncharacterized protein YhbP (UPF0306 family)
MGKNREQLLEFLKLQHILTLATTTDDHICCATPLFYLLRGGICLYWISSASSSHSQSLARGGEVAVAISTSTDQWKDIRGAQLRGRVQIVPETQERKEVLDRYAERFHLTLLLRVAMSQSTLYKFVPTWARYLDNSRHFGYRSEFDLSAENDDSKAT